MSQVMKHRQYKYKGVYRLPPPEERPPLDEPLVLLPDEPEERVGVEGV